MTGAGFKMMIVNSENLKDTKRVWISYRNKIIEIFRHETTKKDTTVMIKIEVTQIENYCQNWGKNNYGGNEPDIQRTLTTRGPDRNHTKTERSLNTKVCPVALKTKCAYTNPMEQTRKREKCGRTPRNAETKLQSICLRLSDIWWTVSQKYGKFGYGHRHDFSPQVLYYQNNSH